MVGLKRAAEKAFDAGKWKKLAYLLGQSAAVEDHLSFAKTASAPMSLRCNAFIAAMQAAHLRDCDNPADT